MGSERTSLGSKLNLFWTTRLYQNNDIGNDDISEERKTIGVEMHTNLFFIFQIINNKQIFSNKQVSKGESESFLSYKRDEVRLVQDINHC